MTTVQEIIRRLLSSNDGEWKDEKMKPCPVWPPDAFAVAATLATLSGCYAKQRPWQGKHNQYLKTVKDAADKWRQDMVVPDEVQKLWNSLIICIDQVSDCKCDKLCLKKKQKMVPCGTSAIGYR